MMSWLSLVLALLCILGFVTLLGYRFLSQLSRAPKAQLEIPETGRLGWWSYQKDLQVLELKAHIESDILNMMRNQTRLHYSLCVRMIGKKAWRPYLSEIHCTETFVSFDPDNVPFPKDFEGLDGQKPPPERPEATLHLTPVIKVKHDESYQGAPIEACITNIRTIGAFHYGQNSLRVQAGQHHTDIVFYQKK